MKRLSRGCCKENQIKIKGVGSGDSYRALHPFENSRDLHVDYWFWWKKSYMQNLFLVGLIY
jgi:hypothetical protein